MSNNYRFVIGADDETAKAFTSVNNNLKKTSSAFTAYTKNSRKAFGGLGRNAGQASIQVQQFVGQLQGGVNPMVALSQQSADLGFVLGVPLVGAVVSIGAAMATFLSPSLFEGSKQTETLTEKLKDLRAEYVLTAEQIDLIASEQSKETKEKKKKISEITKEITKLETLLKVQEAQRDSDAKGRSAEANRKSAVKRIEETTAAIIAQKAALTTLKQETGELERELDFSDLYKDLAADIAITSLELKGSAEEANRLRFALDNGFLSFQEMPEVAKALYAEKARLLNLEQQITQAQKEQLQAKRQAEKDAAQEAQEKESIARSIQMVTESLQSQIIALEVGEQAAYEFGIAQRLNLESAEQIPEAIQAQIDKLYELKNVQTEVGEGGFWETMRGHIENTSQDFDAMWGNSFDRFAGGIGDATSAAILEQQSFSDTMKSIGRSVVSEVISGLVTIAVKKVALAALDKTLLATQTAATTTAAVTQGTAAAAAWAPAAAAASLATGGTNSVPAISGMTAAVGAAAGLFALSSFEGGGYTGDGPRIGGVDGKGGRLAVIHPEEVITDLTKGQSVGSTSNTTINLSVNSRRPNDIMDEINTIKKPLMRLINATQGAPI